jgi:hypothetical protein
LNGIGNSEKIVILTGYTGEDFDGIDTVNTYFNFDFTTFASNSTNTISEVCLANSTADIGCGAAGVAKGIVELENFGTQTDTIDLRVEVKTAQNFGNNNLLSVPFVADVFSYGDGVTVSLAWITGSLSSGQSFSPALSWIPTQAGSYTATAFVWESVDNPTALSPPVSTTITVQ